VVLARSFWSRSFLLPEIFQTCSQLIHTCFVVVLASGLETRNRLQNRQEKNEFYFQFREENFLDAENELRVLSRSQHTACWKVFVRQRRPILNRCTKDFAADFVAHPELTQSMCARNFSALRAKA
jgi:hypothetical protein